LQGERRRSAGTKNGDVELKEDELNKVSGGLIGLLHTDKQ
jgi:hypothetical protein